MKSCETIEQLPGTWNLGLCIIPSLAVSWPPENQFYATYCPWHPILCPASPPEEACFSLGQWLLPFSPHEGLGWIVKASHTSIQKVVRLRHGRRLLPHLDPVHWMHPCVHRSLKTLDTSCSPWFGQQACGKWKCLVCLFQVNLAPFRAQHIHLSRKE